MYRYDRYEFVDFLATPLSKDWVYSEKNRNLKYKRYDITSMNRYSIFEKFYTHWFYRNVRRRQTK